MVQHAQGFDTTFGAIADATRRGVLEQLGRADALITALAKRFQMSLTGMKKQVRILERAGLVRTEKVGMPQRQARDISSSNPSAPRSLR
jgi:predicted transcriptional regulator